MGIFWGKRENISSYLFRENWDKLGQIGILRKLKFMWKKKEELYKFLMKLLNKSY